MGSKVYISLENEPTNIRHVELDLDCRGCSFSYKQKRFFFIVYQLWLHIVEVGRKKIFF